GPGGRPYGPPCRRAVETGSVSIDLRDLDAVGQGQEALCFAMADVLSARCLRLEDEGGRARQRPASALPDVRIDPVGEIGDPELVEVVALVDREYGRDPEPGGALDPRERHHRVDQGDIELLRPG